MTPLRLPYGREDMASISAAELAYLPISLRNGTETVELQGLLDTGSTVNVLPYNAGLALGFSWDQQTIPITLTGSLSNVPAYGVIVTAKVATFSPVELAFAWTRVVDVPLLLGQINFFMEFDICFFRSQGAFEIQPKRRQ
jgi:hypothetical protein